MKAIEIYFWCALYWAFYLPISLLILLWTGQGDVLGILLVGFILTAVLILIFLFEDGVLIPDDLEPAIILRSEPAEEDLKITVIEDKQPAEPAKVEPKPKRKYVRKKSVVEDSVQEPPEVVPDEKEEPETEPVGVEPEPRLRTDVDLGQLDAPDDSNVG